jgi:hypothetical protein
MMMPKMIEYLSSIILECIDPCPWSHTIHTRHCDSGGVCNSLVGLMEISLLKLQGAKKAELEGVGETRSKLLPGPSSPEVSVDNGTFMNIVSAVTDDEKDNAWYEFKRI